MQVFDQGAALSCCPVCDDSIIVPVMKKKGYPLTEQWATPESSPRVGEASVDLELNRCSRCSHFFLGNQIPPSSLYNSDYQTTSSHSQPAVDATLRFLHFVNEFSKLSDFRLVFDIGANDGTLLRQVDAFGFDGIKVALDPSTSSWGPDVAGFQDFIEGFDYSQLPEVHGPRLFLASHVFEHISDPKIALVELAGELRESDLLAIQLPAIEALISQSRLDQIHHQHFHYFSWDSMNVLLGRVGLEIVSSQVDWEHYGAGNLLLRRGNDSRMAIESDSAWEKLSSLAGERHFQASREVFESHVSNVVMQFREIPWVALGAGLMSPIIFYHLEEIWDGCVAIYDGAKQKRGKRYKNTPRRIEPVPPDLLGSNIIITGAVSKGAGRSLFSMAAQKSARSITFPVLFP